MRILTVFLVAVLLSSCGLFKRVVKDKELIRSEHTEQSTKDSIGLIIDKTVIVEKTEIDTVITTPEKTVKETKEGINMDSLSKGLTIISDALLDVKLTLNPLTGILEAVATLHPQKIPVKGNKTVTTHKDLTQKSKQNEAVLTNDKTDSKKTHKEKEPVKTGVILAIVASIIIGILVYLKFIKPK